MKLNKESQATLTALAKLLKELGNKELSKSLTTLRADIKALEASCAEFAEKSGVEVSGETPVVPLTPPEPEPAPVDDAAQPQFDLSGQPVLGDFKMDDKAVVTGFGLTTIEGNGVITGSVQQAPGYELAFYVSPVQVSGSSQFIGRRDKEEGNFTLALFKQI